MRKLTDVGFELADEAKLLAFIQANRPSQSTASYEAGAVIMTRTIRFAQVMPTNSVLWAGQLSMRKT